MREKTIIFDNTYNGVLGLRAWLFFTIFITASVISLIALVMFLGSLPDHEGFRSLDCETMREVVITGTEAHHMEIFGEKCL